MRLVISFAALFLSALLIQLGSGALGPLDALSGASLGWTAPQIGLLGSAHFAGFFIGCWAMPRLIGWSGHARAFAAAASVGILGVILHPILQGPVEWAALRVLSGMSIAGCYTVIEAWMQAKLEKKNRGRIYGIYRMVDLTGGICAQALIAVLTPAAYVSYNIVAIFCVLCLLPLALTRQVPPSLDHPPVLAPIRAWKVSPLACFAIVMAGATGASFRMVGPVVGIEYDLSPDEIAAFLIAAVLGAAVAQVPIGWMADKSDRRWVLNSLSGFAIVVCLIGALFVEPGNAIGLVAVSAGFGMTSLTVYSVAAAHANDFCDEDFVVELNASLIFFFSAGAIAAPLAASEIIAAAGASGLFWFIAGAHAVLIAFTVYRMTRRTATPNTAYRYRPRTSMLGWPGRPDQNGKTPEDKSRDLEDTP
ncbi:MAG: MFS transporter [Pseudomonadota bacterium]